METILITGASGFLGSHIAEDLVNRGYRVVALKRSSSNLWRCSGFMEQINWINCDNISNASYEIINFNPDVLIHTAWNGVNATDRENWIGQEMNLSYLTFLLEIIKKSNVRKIIALGSQSEYGNFEGSVDENYPCNPKSAYGTCKVCASYILKSFAEQNNIDWYWIRLFSIFGPREDGNWLIPSTINSLMDKKELSLTPCEQKYDYLFSKDFVLGIFRIVEDKYHNSGIYNLSSGNSVRLKDILNYLEKELSPQLNILKIGDIPYRSNQVMHMQGNSDKFFKIFDYKPHWNIFEGLEETINYYKKQRIDEQNR